MGIRPFYVLMGFAVRLYKTENLEALKDLIRYDIIDSINKNVAAGNITATDGQKLKRITLQLYHHIYAKYDEMEKAGVNQMAEEALILDIDIIELEHKKELKRLAAEKDTIISEKDNTILEKDNTIRNLVAQLQKAGIPEDQILAATNLTKEELQRMCIFPGK